MMHVRDQYCFTHDGKDVRLFTLKNKKDTTVTITNYGAIVTSFALKMSDGSINDIVLGFNDPKDYLAKAYTDRYPWFGAIIGRHANRIKNAEVEILGKKYLLSKNDGEQQLHGGKNGFDKKVWHITGQGSDPVEWLELQYTSPDGEEGYPGNLNVSIRFELTDDNELIYSCSATTDQATIVNLTHHDYFNLDTIKDSVIDHEVKIYSNHTLEQDTDLVANGNLVTVEDTPFDLRQFLSIGEGLKKAGDFDKSFVADKNGFDIVAEVRSPQSGLSLQVYSTEPVVHFYTGKWIPEIMGKHNISYKPYSGFCLETQIHPNAANVPQFPNTILLPGETYFQKTMYRVF